MPNPVPQAMYVGDSHNGCYYQVTQDFGGWFATLIDDFGTFVCTIGPFKTRNEARVKGQGTAFGWCADNSIMPEGDYPDFGWPERRSL